MSSQYTPRHGAKRQARVPSPASVRRPVVGAGIALALVASVGATVEAGPSSAAGAGEPASGRLARSGDALTALTAATSTDVQRLEQDRRTAAASRSASREQERLAEVRRKAAEKKAAAERKKAAEARKRKAAQEKLKAVQANPKPHAQQMVRDMGWGDEQFGCLNQLWIGESDWRWDATNPSSGAYGIPQSLPASKMVSAGPDWKTNPATQIRWGLDYIKQSYGSPCGALSFWNAQSPHWY